MQERVCVRTGKKPIIITAVHGADDTNTAILAEKVAEVLDAYAVINRGFERSKDVDATNDKADCNSIKHLKQPVVYDEFLSPFSKFAKTLNEKFLLNLVIEESKNPLIIHIHGAGNSVHKHASKAGKSMVFAVLGYGIGREKDSLTCPTWKIDCLRDHLMFYAGSSFCVLEGGRGSRYAGRDSNNLNQYFRKHLKRYTIDSIQIEIPFSLRKDRPTSEHTAAVLSCAIYQLRVLNHYQPRSASVFI